MTVSQTLLVFGCFDSFKESWLGILSFHWDMGDVFLMVRGLGLGEEEHRKKMPFSSRHIRDTRY